MGDPPPPELDPREWFAQGWRRRELVRVAADREGFTPEAVELLQGAAERWLKGYLLSQGWRLIKTHNLDTLIDAAAQFDVSFRQFTDWAERLTEDFFAAHYPGAGEESFPDFEELRQQTDELILLIRKLLPELVLEVPADPPAEAP